MSTDKSKQTQLAETNGYTDDESAMITANNDPTIAASIVSNITQGKPYFWTSKRFATREQRLECIRMLNDKENGIDKILHPNKFAVSDVIVTQAMFMDADGKQVVTPKCVLIDANGDTVSIMARVWVTEFLQTWLFMGNPPWEEPLIVSAKQVKGNGANRYYSLFLP